MYGDPGYEIADVGYTHASNYLSDGQVARLRTTYKASVMLADHWLGHFLDHLGLDDSTAILLVSDHGVFRAARSSTTSPPTPASAATSPPSDRGSSRRCAAASAPPPPASRPAAPMPLSTGRAAGRSGARYR